MFEDFSFKKLVLYIVLLAGAYHYVRTHYHRPDVMRYSATLADHDMRARVRYYVGLSYFMQSQYEPAIDAFNTLLTDDPTCQYEAKALLHLGESNIEMRRFADARTAYEKYMQDFPHGADLEVVQTQYEFIKFK
ncbi:MAG: tetratricopeptide repeat protein [Elusimicrobia bacterium]|nr:tetratricopeptide repeat protein [Elusimicrobiota bacterium]